jgi:hypothetical protein
VIVLYFTWLLTEVIHFKFELWRYYINRAHVIKGLGIILDSRFYFHPHVVYVFPQALKLLGRIHAIMFFFSSVVVFSCYILC